MYKHFFKRVLDFLISLIALLLIGWFLIIVAIFLHFSNKGAGAFFVQDRPGKDAKMFKVIKFKTMTDERDADGNLLPVEHQDALLPVHQDSAVRFIGPGGVDDHEIVRLLGEGLGIIKEFAHSHNVKVSVARYAFFVPIPRL